MTTVKVTNIYFPFYLHLFAMVFRFTFNRVINYCITDDQKDNPGYVEAKLAELLEEKVQERREFRTIIEQFRYTNKDLYQKMAQAGETRNNALGFNKKAKWKLALVLPQDNTNELKSSPYEDAKNSPAPVLKSKTGKGKFGKRGKVSLGKNTEKKLGIEDDEEVMDDNDEVIQSLKWAHDILLKEFGKRKKIREKKKSLKRRAHKKLQTLWAFHHQNEVTKKAKKKAQAEGRDGIYDNMNKEDTDKKEEQGALIDGVEEKIDHDIKLDAEEEDIEREEAKRKRKVIIINLQKRLSFKKASRDKDRDRVLKTEEQKLKEAQEHLAYLQEKQKTNIIVDFFGVPKAGKNTNKIVEVVQSLSRHGSQKSNPSLSRQGSAHSTHGDNLEVEKNKGTGMSKNLMHTFYFSCL